MTPERIAKLKLQAEKDAAELRLLLLTNVGAVWDAAQGVWRINGRRVSIDSIRSYLLRIETQMSRRIIRLIDELEKENITLAAWQREFDRSIASSHILAGALAVGGIGVSVASAFIIGRIASEFEFADDFVKEIRGKKAGSFSAIKSRAKSYYRAATITYSNVEQQVRQVIGIQTEAKRVLRASESCIWCKRFAKWLPIEKQPPIGQICPPMYPKSCCRFCRCYLVYR